MTAVPPTGPSLLTPADYTRMPWKNGLGVTTELVRVLGDDGEVDWRVSIADVTADGPFSRFPGYDRLIATIDGPGMVLRHAEREGAATLDPLVPYHFRGEWDTHCTLRGGPLRDLNLMLRRARLRGELDLFAFAAGEEEDFTGIALLLCLAGRVQVAVAGIEHELAREESLLAADPTDPAGPSRGWSWRLRAAAADTRVAVVTLARS